MSALRLFVGLAALLAVGCSEPSSAPTSPSLGGSSPVTADQLSGAWTLVSMQRTGESVQPAPAGATYTVTFGDSRLTTRVDCNTCSGTFGLSGQTLTLGPALACTRAACPTMAFENEYTRLLGGESSVTVSAATLLLSSPRGTLLYRR
jgi:heat shock protein HslJ